MGASVAVMAVTPRIPFPTGNNGVGGATVLGYPDQAKPCDGHVRLLDDDRCIWCGRLTAMTIVRTFAERGRRVFAGG